MNIEKIVLNEERNVTLTAYIQETEGRFDYIEKRPGMLIIPGAPSSEIIPTYTHAVRQDAQCFVNQAFRKLWT